MADQSRSYLKQGFDDGERPTGKDFADLIDSFINKEDDKIRLTAGDNLSIPAGITLGNSATGVTGTLRYNNNRVEVFSGGTWGPVAGESGAFTQVAGGPSVAFGAGNVGIGPFAVAPTHKLEVPLTANLANPSQRIRLGNMVTHNGSLNDAAYIANQGQANADTSFALRQTAQGQTTLNSVSGTTLVLAQNNVTRFQVGATGNINIIPQASVVIEGNTSIGTPGTPRNLLVTGTASKPGGGPFTDSASDIRVKKDVRQIEFGLKEICRLNPVFYKFTGDAGLPEDGREYVGLIAQELQEVLPFMVRKAEDASSHDKEKRDLLTYESGPLTFLLINAVRELTERVEKLEAQLAKKNPK